MSCQHSLMRERYNMSYRGMVTSIFHRTIVVSNEFKEMSGGHTHNDPHLRHQRKEKEM